MTLGEKIKEARKQCGLSQEQLAEKMSVSRSAIAKWENGLGLPNDESLKLLADYFGITIDELIPNKSNEEILVSKNKTIDQQKKVIIGFAAGCAKKPMMTFFCWSMVLFFDTRISSLLLFGISSSIVIPK